MAALLRNQAVYLKQAGVDKMPGPAATQLMLRLLVVVPRLLMLTKVLYPIARLTAGKPML